MTRVAEKAVDDGLVVLGRSLEGGLIRPGDASYEEARTLFNSMIDKRPAAVAQCATTEDVVTALRSGSNTAWRSRCGPAGTPWPACRCARGAS